MVKGFLLIDPHNSANRRTGQSINFDAASIAQGAIDSSISFAMLACLRERVGLPFSQ